MQFFTKGPLCRGLALWICSEASSKPAARSKPYMPPAPGRVSSLSTMMLSRPGCASARVAPRKIACSMPPPSSLMWFGYGSLKRSTISSRVKLKMGWRCTALFVVVLLFVFCVCLVVLVLWLLLLLFLCLFLLVCVLFLGFFVSFLL